MKERSTISIVRVLGRLSARWLDPQDAFRRKAVNRLVERSGFSEKMSEAMIHAIFSELTETKLRKLLRAEFKDPRVLDDFKKDKESGAQLRARGPRAILHIFSANAPQAAILSFIQGMLLKSHNVGKLSVRDAGFLDIYLLSLKALDRELWRMNALIDPKNRAALAAQLNKADLVVAYGSDESLGEIRKAVPSATPFFGYGHRLSAAFYSRQALNLKDAPRLAALAAHDVWMADQRGCLSPTALYAQKGGPVSPREFAALVAKALQRKQSLEKKHARRGLGIVSGVYALHGGHLIQKIKGRTSGWWESRPRGLWAVVYDEDLKPISASSSQLIRVKGYEKMGQVYAALHPIQKYLQCISLECAPGERKKISEKLSELGVNRICRAGKMQHPPITWHHDGKPNLVSWVKWTDLES